MPRPRKEPPKQSVSVIEAPPKRDLAYIPDRVIRFFAATGKRVSLASDHPNSISNESTHYRYPVRLRDFGDKATQDEFTELLTGECGFQARGDNFGKGDCLLYIQSVAAYEDLLAEGREANAQQYGEESWESNLGVIDDMLRQKFGEARGRRPAKITSDYRETPVLEQLHPEA